MYSFLYKKYEDFHPIPQWTIDLSPSGRTDSDFYIFWLTKSRKIKLGIIVIICALSLIYNFFTLLSTV